MCAIALAPVADGGAWAEIQLAREALRLRATPPLPPPLVPHTRQYAVGADVASHALLAAALRALGAAVPLTLDARSREGAQTATQSPQRAPPRTRCSCGRHSPASAASPHSADADAPPCASADEEANADADGAATHSAAASTWRALGERRARVGQPPFAPRLINLNFPPRAVDCESSDAPPPYAAGAQSPEAALSPSQLWSRRIAAAHAASSPRSQP